MDRSIEATTSKRTIAAICAALVVITLAVYAQVAGFEFVNLDDPVYVYQNPHVLKGLSIGNIAWAFTTTSAANWHPLTWLSLMLDAQIAGKNPGLYHLHNLLLHLISTLLLFALLRRMTGFVWRSAFVAALFAIHPLHVESVAWVTERKDVLSTVLWLLTTWAYVRYTHAPRARTYLPVVVLFALGLLAKPMLVTLPLTLLILDYWPLGRLQVKGYRLQGKGADRLQVTGDRLQGKAARRGRSETRHPSPKTQHPSPSLLIEKIPLFVLSAGSCVATYLAQSRGEAVAPMFAWTVGMRIGNAAVSCATYVSKMVWPSGLAMVYPLPKAGQPAWLVAAAALFVVGVSVLVWRGRSRFPFAVAGWLWYLVTLIPVVGLVQVGMQARADRYTYVPLIGLFVLIAWLVPELVSGARAARRLAVTAMVVVLALAGCAWRQAGYWRDSIALTEHAIAVVRDNAFAHINLGLALEDKGQRSEAVRHYQTALEIDPHYDAAHGDLGNAYYALGDAQAALSHYQEAVRLNPNRAGHHVNLGGVLIRLGQVERGIAECEEGLRLDPESLSAHNEIAYGMILLGRIDEAVPHCDHVLSVDPSDADAHVNLGLIELNRGNPAEAASQFRTALEIEPKHGDAHNNLGVALVHQNRIGEAMEEFKTAISLEPNRPDFRRNLQRARVLAGMK